MGNSVGLKRQGKSSWESIDSPLFSKRTKVSVINGTEVLKQCGEYGFGLIAGVGQGSAHAPCLIKVHYKPRTRRQKPVRKISLIGKGVTFDTGGVDLKMTDNYDKMHYDMAGAATALGVMRLAENNDLPVEIVGLFPLVHNAVGPNAIQRHDIITAYNGTRVEIMNTDAEGRLILADAIAYSEKEVRPDCTITLATLCDIEDITLDILQVVATNDTHEKYVRIAEQKALEKVIYWPRLEYLNAVDDDYIDDTQADIKNDISFASNSRGVVFIANFFDWERGIPNWIHIDQSVIFHKDASDYCAGPGFGLRLVWNIVKQFA